MVDRRAHLAEDVEVGPYAIIEGPVTVGEGTWIGPHAYLSGNTEIGRRCRIFPFSVIGTPPQDRTFQGENTRIEIGDENVIREHVTIHAGTLKGRGLTKIGHRNWFLVGSHVAHDCMIGDENTVANGALLAGHVEVGSNVMISGCVAVHQFCRIGRLAMVGGITGVSLDIPPFTLVQGIRARLMGLNRVGLKRAGIGGERLRLLQEAYRALFRSRRPLEERLAAARGLGDDMASELADFVQGSRRGVCFHEAEEAAVGNAVPPAVPPLPPALSGLLDS